MYRLAIIAILLAAAVSDTLGLQGAPRRGWKGTRASDRVKEVCRAVYGEIRNQERESELAAKRRRDSEEASGMAAMALYTGSYDDSGARLDFPDHLEDYGEREEERRIEKPRRKPIGKRGFFRPRLTGGARLGRYKPSRGSHTHHHLDSDITINFDNVPLPVQDDSSISPESRIWIPPKSTGDDTGGKQSLESSATTEINAEKTTETLNSGRTEEAVGQPFEITSNNDDDGKEVESGSTKNSKTSGDDKVSEDKDSPVRKEAPTPESAPGRLNGNTNVNRNVNAIYGGSRRGLLDQFGGLSEDYRRSLIRRPSRNRNTNVNSNVNRLQSNGGKSDEGASPAARFPLRPVIRSIDDEADLGNGNGNSNFNSNVNSNSVGSAAVANGVGGGYDGRTSRKRWAS